MKSRDGMKIGLLKDSKRNMREEKPTKISMMLSILINITRVKPRKRRLPLRRSQRKRQRKKHQRKKPKRLLLKRSLKKKLQKKKKNFKLLLPKPESTRSTTTISIEICT